MPLSFPQLFAAIWLAWLAYWAISARNVKPVQRREPLASRLAHILPLTVAAALLLGGPEPPMRWLSQRWLPASVAWASAGAAITIVGLALTAWARTTLGTNWSGTVTVKRDHELVVAGLCARPLVRPTPTTPHGRPR